MRNTTTNKKEDEMEKVKTSKDYKKKIAPVSWAVLTKDSVVMEKDFLNKKDAEDFRDNAYCGYYSNCKVQLLKSK